MIHRAGFCAAVVAGLAAALPAHAECVLPPPPSKIPDANTATEQEMIVAMKTIKQYEGDVQTYFKCLEFDAKRGRISDDERTRMHNAALDRLKVIAERFNEQVRIFKAKNG